MTLTLSITKHYTYNYTIYNVTRTIKSFGNYIGHFLITKQLCNTYSFATYADDCCPKHPVNFTYFTLSQEMFQNSVTHWKVVLLRGIHSRARFLHPQPSTHELPHLSNQQCIFHSKMLRLLGASRPTRRVSRNLLVLVTNMRHVLVEMKPENAFSYTSILGLFISLRTSSIISRSSTPLLLKRDG